MQRLEFSTADLPPSFDDRARFSIWHELCIGNYCSMQLARPEDVPFSVRFEAIRLDTQRVCHFRGTVSDVARRPSHVAADGSDSFVFGFSRRGRMNFYQRGREAVIEPGAATLLDDSETGGFKAEPDNEWVALTLSRKQLLWAVAGVENLPARPVADGPALRHLRGYLDLLIDGSHDDDPALDLHIETTLLDLVTLTLGASRDAADVAQQRGLRAAQVQTLIAEIRKNYARPWFSPAHLAQRLGVSERYVQELLQNTGATFTERVLELRLQHARAMLTDPRHNGLRIIEIALQSGFGDVSNFYRFFRRRFGVTPTLMRGGVTGEVPP